MLALPLALCLPLQTYAFKWTTIPWKEGPYYEREQIRVYNRKTGRTIWTRSYLVSAVAEWSPNKKTLAVFDYEWGLTVWRVGQKVRYLRLKLPKRIAGFGEPAYGIEWSPDGQRLLLHVPGSGGDQTLGVGLLFSVRPSDGRLEVGQFATRAEWRGRRTVRFWTLDYEKNEEHDRPKTWKVR